MSEHLEQTRNKLSRIKDIENDLKKIKTKKFTSDENALYLNFKNNIIEYDKLVNSILADGKVSMEEMENIQIIEKKILQDARATVLEDGKVTSEEAILLKKLIAIFETLTD